VKAVQVREYLNKTTGPDRTHPQVLWEVVNDTARPQQLVKVPENWKQTNVTPIFKKRKREDWRIQTYKGQDGDSK